MNLKTIAAVKRIGIVVLALLVVIGSMLVIYPFMTQNAKLATDISAAQAAKDDVQGKLSTMNNLKATNEQVKELDAEISKKFPATADTPGFAAFVGKAAADAGLSLENITDLTTTIPTLSSAGAPVAPAPEAAATAPAKDAAPKDDSSAAPPAAGASNLAEMNVTINAMGPIDKLQNFVSNLKNGPRNILISTYSVQEGGAATEGVTTTAIVSGKTYIYRPIVVPSTETPAAPTTPTTPADPSAPATAPTP